MEKRTKLSELEPLFFGRLSRVIFGLLTFGLILYLGPNDLPIWALIALALLGLSFLVGGLVANRGCELTALPNLALPPEKRVHFT